MLTSRKVRVRVSDWLPVVGPLEVAVVGCMFSLGSGSSNLCPIMELSVATAVYSLLWRP